MTGAGQGLSGHHGHGCHHGHGGNHDHSVCSCSKEKVIKVALATIILLIAIQFGFNAVFYHKYQPFFLVSSPVNGDTLRVKGEIRQAGSNGTDTGSFGNIRDFIISGKLRDTGRQMSRPGVRELAQHSGNDTDVQQAEQPPVKQPAEQPAREVNTTTTKAALELCPLIPPNLQSGINVDRTLKSFDEIKESFPDVMAGGHWKPPDCISRHRVAIVIPYRDREPHLKVFLNHMHKFLGHQQLDYAIFVVEIAQPTKFNRAMLMNVGYAEALKQYDYQCFVFHDVDLMPEDERNIYSCPAQPRHMSVAIDTMNYRLPYEGIFGGVCAITKEQMIKVNGFSNKFFGWGGEDDDMHNRIVAKGYKIIRYPVAIARYKMLSHKKDRPSPERMNLLYQGKKRFATDGINSLKYKVLKLELRPLYTWVYVEINEAEVRKS